MRDPMHARPAGFTLLEVVIAIAVIAILVSIALPAYQNYILKSHRASAKTALLDLASREESYYATNNTYTSTLSTLGYSGSPVYVPGGGNNFYTVTIPSATATGFTLLATAYGSQANDSCGNYQLDNLGNRYNIVGTASATAVSGCW